MNQGLKKVIVAVPERAIGSSFAKTDLKEHYDSAKNQNKLNSKHIEHIVEIYREFNDGKLKVGVVEDKFSYVAILRKYRKTILT